MSSITKKQPKAVFTGPSRTVASKASHRKSVAPQSVDSQSRVRKSIFGGTSRTLLSSSSRKNAAIGAVGDKLGPQRPPLQVFDESGQDVTPQPLLQMDASAVRKNQSNILADSSGGTPTDLMSQASIYQTGTITASTFGGGPFTRSVFSASQSGRSTGSITEDIGEGAGDMGTGWTDTKVHYKREDVQEDLTEEDLDVFVNINLSETETIWLVDMPGICVSLESDEAPTVREQNERYRELKALGFQDQLIKSRVGNDRYMERGMNTFNEPPKFKNLQTMKITHVDAAVNASNWDMHDTYKLVAEMEAKAKEDADEEAGSRPISAIEEEKKDGEKEDGGKKDQSTSVVKGGTTVSLQKSGVESQTTMSSMMGTESLFQSHESGVAGVVDQEAIDRTEILQSEALKNHLVIMERVVNLNTYQPRQAQYRGFEIYPNIVDGQEDENQQEVVVDKKKKKEVVPLSVLDQGIVPALDRLWMYTCPLTKGRNVSCIAWNKVNPDLMAVGYGSFDFTSQKQGMVCCWSLKNPEFPERVYTTEQGVMSLDFSLAHPNLLAAGLYDGTVAIFNVRSSNNDPILDSLKNMRYTGEESESAGKHTGPVWQLRWIEKERGSEEERSEVLISISTDGRVTQWSIRKGFESYDLMKLKRVSNRQSVAPPTQAQLATGAPPPPPKGKKPEAFISRYAGGLCFDFSAKDSNIYLAGTEDGHIHKCSCSYNEQYLDSYFGHTGPVYSIQWSPFLPDVFLSCSGDWSIRLWHQDRLQPILSFFSSTKSVPSVCWSPRHSTVFACVNEGAVEVWDLSQTTLDPVITLPVPLKLSAITFSKNSECVLVGDQEGDVYVLELQGLSDPPENQAEALNKIIQSSINSQLQKK